ncbi:hypothetical protein B0H67DRAFT_560432 [Lasiosphaeris hirsuta]|uniref:Uncharacterized protein n=1 Tax=Lasiosphaeris hirsuta TaxID=260670 RepID=A0AA40EAE3_9PEZI|nr:hypothetical protein B0H67DRAFT_560432 [Lasiosphaeris hirsuta]
MSRNAKASEQQSDTRFDEGTANSHPANDSKDPRSIANRLAAAEVNQEEPKDDKETALHEKDPTLPPNRTGANPRGEPRSMPRSRPRRRS